MSRDTSAIGIVKGWSFHQCYSGDLRYCDGKCMNCGFNIKRRIIMKAKDLIREIEKLPDADIWLGYETVATDDVMVKISADKKTIMICESKE